MAVETLSMLVVIATVSLLAYTLYDALVLVPRAVAAQAERSARALEHREQQYRASVKLAAARRARTPLAERLRVIKVDPNTIRYDNLIMLKEEHF